MPTEYLWLGRGLSSLCLRLPGHRDVEGRLGGLWRRNWGLAGLGGRDRDAELLSLGQDLGLCLGLQHLWLL